MAWLMSEPWPRHFEILRWIGTVGILAGIALMVVPLGLSFWFSVACIAIGALAFCILIPLALMLYRRKECIEMLLKLEDETRRAVSEAAHAGDRKQVAKLLADTGMKSKHVQYYAGFVTRHIASIERMAEADARA